MRIPYSLPESASARERWWWRPRQFPLARESQRMSCGRLPRTVSDRLAVSSGPPTIAFDVQPGSGGPARYVDSLVHGLSSEGWQVVFPLTGKPGDLSGQLPDPKTEHPADVHPVWRRLAATLVRCAPACIRYAAGFANTSLRISRQVAAQRIHLFHAQNTGCEEAPVGCRWGGQFPVLGTLHVEATFDPSGRRNRYLQRSLAWISNRCLHGAIAVSEATKRDWTAKTGLPESRITVIHNGIDPARICRNQSAAAARARLGLPTDALVVGAMGRLDRVKGFEYLIDAVGLLAPRFPQVVLAIAGDGPLAAELADQVAHDGLQQRVRFVGYCRDINLFLDACDLFVLSSLSEALPYALLEAMAHELPAVGTSVGGVPEVILPDETGFLIPPRDGPALAIALRPLLESAELRERLGRAGRARVVRHFHEADMVRKTLEIYRSLLARNRQS